MDIKIKLVLQTNTQWFLKDIPGGCEVRPTDIDSSVARRSHLNLLAKNLKEGNKEMQSQLRAGFVVLAMRNEIKKPFPMSICSVSIGEIDPEHPFLIRAYFGRIVEKHWESREYIFPLTVFRG